MYIMAQFLIWHIKSFITKCMHTSVWEVAPNVIFANIILMQDSLA
jgi:hypothetical protein